MKALLKCLILSFGVIITNAEYLVYITSLVVPERIVNGSDAAVLDCQYKLPFQDYHTFLIKWLHNDQLVYEWTPGRQGKSFGLLEGRLDLGYIVSDDMYQRHRAIRIFKPTVELSGEYECQVHYDDSHVWKKATMMVYAPPKELTLSACLLPDNMVSITCTAENVFPQPMLELHVRIWSLTSVLNSTSSEFRSINEESYSAVISKLIPKEDLGSHMTGVQCILSLPNANFEEKTDAVYDPEEIQKCKEPISQMSAAVTNPVQPRYTRESTHIDEKIITMLQELVGEITRGVNALEGILEKIHKSD